MKIIEFEFQDNHQGWKVEKFTLSNFTLLVGRSGAGKTRILSALRAIREVATGGSTTLFKCSWTLVMDINGKRFRWIARTDHKPAGLSPEPPFLIFGPVDDFYEDDGLQKNLTLLEEKIDIDGIEIVNRKKKDVTIAGRATIPLKMEESVISLLREEESIKTIYQGFERFLSSRAHSRNIMQSIDKSKAKKDQKRFLDISKLRATIGLPLIYKAWIFQENFPKEFERFKRSYQEIFPTISDLKITWDSDFLQKGDSENASIGTMPLLDIGFRENGVSSWVRSYRMSSGMKRTLVHLMELALAPSGSIMLVDEYENSLGVNCLGSLTEHLLTRTKELQFILTSHHPYVIDNIDKKYWKVVTRKGNVVQVQDATQFPELDTSSRQSAFTQLLSVLEQDEVPQ